MAKYSIDGLIYWAPEKKLGGGWIPHKDSPDPPPAPDYAGAAQATAAGNADAARIAAKANRVSQYTPYGSSVYTDLGNDRWRQDISLSPAQQQLLDYQNKTSLGLGELTGKGLGYVSDMLSNPFDTAKLPGQQINAGQTAQEAIMARLDPKFGQTEEALRTRLANQGIAPGTEAWNNEMRGFQEAKNDAYMQAALQGMGIGQQARQQALQEQAFLRNEPLNTLNAVRTGAQVTNPAFSSVPQQATTQGPDLLNAAQQGYNAQLGQFNAQQAGKNNMMGGLFSLGSAALGSPWVGGIFNS